MITFPALLLLLRFGLKGSDHYAVSVGNAVVVGCGRTKRSGRAGEKRDFIRVEESSRTPAGLSVRLSGVGMQVSPRRVGV